MRSIPVLIALAALAPSLLAQKTSHTSSQTTLAASANPITIGLTETLTATITPAPASGTVTFSVLGIPLATAPVTAGTASLEFPTVSVLAGVYPVTAQFSGNSSIAASVSLPLSITVAARTPTSVGIAASQNPVALNSTEKLTATVLPATATGTVRFTTGGATLATATISAGKATVSLSASGVPTGTYPIRAAYSGDASDAPSTSAPLSIQVTPAGTPLSACADITTTGSYYLTQDVTSAATCFFIDADNIALNLNGHTITYGTGGGTASTPALLLADTWYTAPGYSLARTGTTNHHGGFSVFNGKIVASPNAAQRSTCIWVGQSDDITPAPVIHDLTLTTFAQDASPIFGTVSAPGWQVYNNVISYGSLLTSSRYNLWGYAIWIADDPNAGTGAVDNIYNNTIVAAPQGGIFDDHQLASIHNNDIAFNAFFANDYCVANVSGNNQAITGNNCHPTSGRGIDVEASGTTVSNNTITVTELPQIAEYNGCEGGGADGIRLRDNAYQGNPASPVGVTVSGNTIHASSAACQANGIRLTSLIAGDSATFTGNTVTTTGPATAALPDYAISFDGTDGAVTTFNANTFSSSYAWVNVDWDGANGAINSGQTWNGTPVYALDNENGFYGTNPPTFTQSITVEGTGTGNIRCGVSAAGLTQFQSTSKTCN